MQGKVLTGTAPENSKWMWELRRGVWFPGLPPKKNGNYLGEKIKKGTTHHLVTTSSSILPPPSIWLLRRPSWGGGESIHSRNYRMTILPNAFPCWGQFWEVKGKNPGIPTSLRRADSLKEGKTSAEPNQLKSSYYLLGISQTFSHLFLTRHLESRSKEGDL